MAKEQNPSGVDPKTAFVSDATLAEEINARNESLKLLSPDWLERKVRAAIPISSHFARRLAVAEHQASRIHNSYSLLKEKHAEEFGRIIVFRRKTPVPQQSLNLHRTPTPVEQGIGIVVPLPKVDNLSKDSERFLVVMSHKALSRVLLVEPDASQHAEKTASKILSPNKKSYVISEANAKAGHDPMQAYVDMLLENGVRIVASDDQKGPRRTDILDKAITQVIALIDYRTSLVRTKRESDMITNEVVLYRNELAKALVIDPSIID